MPQLFRSVWRSRQTPPQMSRPVVHETAQVPRAQTVPEGQALPQVPQLAMSLVVSRQEPMHSVRPSTHDT